MKQISDFKMLPLYRDKNTEHKNYSKLESAGQMICITVQTPIY